ncbi:MAG: hypothetical protein N2049_00670 [Anaerolineales bacterium]|nr:hypothetical protein [Anaerolineales bacterium]
MNLLAWLFLSAGFLLQLPQPQVTYPLPGDVLRGRVMVIGSANVEGFRAYELAFTYPGHLEQALFLIYRSENPVQDGILGTWDTTLIVDGEYELVLTVFRAEAAPITVIVPSLQVRNDIPAVTSTPVLLQPMLTAQATWVVQVSQATFTPLPANPAEVTSSRLARFVVITTLSMLAGLFLFAFLLRPRDR